MTQEHREEELMPMLQELTTDFPGEKMRAKTGLKANTVNVTAAFTFGSVY